MDSGCLVWIDAFLKSNPVGIVKRTIADFKSHTKSVVFIGEKQNGAVSDNAKRQKLFAK